MLPPENVYFYRALEMPFPMFSRGKFHQSKNEKTRTIHLSNFVVSLSAFGTTDVSVH